MVLFFFFFSSLHFAMQGEINNQGCLDISRYFIHVAICDISFGHIAMQTCMGYTEIDGKMTEIDGSNLAGATSVQPYTLRAHTVNDSPFPHRNIYLNV